ncbi:MAG: nuclear transport factor 2 family protein [Cyclobacteriaceae bacterium]
MKELIEEFYQAFHDLDAEKMANCYHEDIVFWDPAFGELKGARAGNMWRMLCKSQKGKDFKIESSDIEATEESGQAHWEAHYTFSQTGRRVHNKIDASFEFKDGKIIKHKDQFDLYRWSRQAMGLTGLMIGWSGFFRSKINKTTNSLLDKFEASL